MKTTDAPLEEEVLSIMLKGEDLARLGVQGLIAEDFVAFNTTIRPSNYTRLIFKKIQTNVKAGGSAHFSTIRRAIRADSNIPESHQDSYEKLVERLHITPVNNESTSYLQQVINQLKLVTRKRVMENSIMKIYERLNAEDIAGAEEAFIEQAKDQSRFRGEKDPVVIDYNDDYEKRLEEARSPCVNNVIITGIPFIDDNMGGITKGEAHCILGRTGGGKSVTMQHITANVVKLGSKVVYYTKEDTERQVAYRFDAHFSGIEHPRFHRHELTDQDFRQWESGVGNVPTESLRIVRMPPNFTMEMVEEVYLQQMGAGFNPDLIVVDHVNLMKATRPTRSEYETISQVMEEFKAFLLEYVIGGLTAAQLRPEAYNKTELSMEDIGGSKRGVSTNVDGLYGLIATDEMRSLNQARVQVMKARSTQIITPVYNVETNLNQIAISDRWRIGRTLIDHG